MIATLASFAVIILLAMIIFFFRNPIRVWVHSKYGVRVFESLESKMESGKLFDAYLSYSVADEMFVRQVMCGELEVGSNYRVCLHHRDLPGSTVLSDTVIRASEAAQRTIVIVSPNFLKTEWSRYDYKSGLLQAVNNGTKKVIFVILGNIDNSQMDPNLRLLLKNNTVLLPLLHIRPTSASVQQKFTRTDQRRAPHVRNILNCDDLNLSLTQ